MKPYRPCVVAVIFNQQKKFLSGERADIPGNWQLPQGGIDGDETPEQAVIRELQEEIGCGELNILHRLKDPITYEFPEDLDTRVSRKFRGQEQYWFVLEFKPGAAPSLEDSDGEFMGFDWLDQESLIQGVVHWKQDAYRAGFSQLASFIDERLV